MMIEKCRKSCAFIGFFLFTLMGLKNEQLQSLVRKTWDLHVRINEKIQENGFRFCRNCSNHGRHCVIAEGCLGEKEKMMDIRDSLQDVHNILICLKGLKSRQNQRRDEALSRLEESRKTLIRRINEYPKKGNESREVIEELITIFVKNEFPLNFNGRIDEKIEPKKVSVWKSSFVVEFVVIFASIYASVVLSNRRHKNNNNSLAKGMVVPLLDVLCGRG